MDKKNTLLLTVIAIATLLVAVVGATFAYFTATTQGEANTNVNVTTKTIDTSNFATNGTITIDASQVNFASGLGSLYGEAKGKVAFTANDAQDSSMCYNVSVDISSNDFEYSIGNQYPELVLEIWKKEEANQDSDNESWTTVDVTNGNEAGHYKSTLYFDGDKSLEYKANVLESTKVCKSTSATEQSADCTDSQPISGFDVTTLGSEKGSLQDLTSITIPNKTSGIESYSANDMVHKLEATKGKTTIQYWYFKLTLVNYTDGDKEEAVTSGNQNKNVGKAFNAKINFKSTPCVD